MFRLTAVYKNTEHGHFNFEYYIQNHLTMVVPLIGESVIRTEVAKGIKGIEEDASPYVAIAHIYLSELNGLQSALLNYGEQIMNDVPKFTNITPVLNIEEIVTQ